jgi:hypothetical protein
MLLVFLGLVTTIWTIFNTIPHARGINHSGTTFTSKGSLVNIFVGASRSARFIASVLAITIVIINDASSAIETSHGL